MRHETVILRFFTLVTALIVISGCGVKIQTSNPIFDQVAGHGPLLLVANDATLASNKFFEEHRSNSASLGHLIEQQGLPEAISVEREFLQPTKLKLFYTSSDQVYILSREEGQWFVVGSEPLSERDIKALQKQRAKRATIQDDALPRPSTPTAALEVRPVANVASSELRGRLRPPSAAEVALLTRTRSGDYVHHVTFPGETLYTLAEWYTDDGHNVATLARASNRSVAEPLRLGDRITIPRQMLTNASPLPEAIVP